MRRDEGKRQIREATVETRKGKGRESGRQRGREGLGDADRNRQRGEVVRREGGKDAEERQRCET
jgi:hypothetical protein